MKVSPPFYLERPRVHMIGFHVSCKYLSSCYGCSCWGLWQLVDEQARKTFWTKGSSWGLAGTIYKCIDDLEHVWDFEVCGMVWYGALHVRTSISQCMDGPTNLCDSEVYGTVGACSPGPRAAHGTWQVHISSGTLSSEIHWSGPPVPGAVFRVTKLSLLSSRKSFTC